MFRGDLQHSEEARQYGPGGLTIPTPDVTRYHLAYGSVLRPDRPGPRGPYAPGVRHLAAFPPPPQQRLPQCKVLPFPGSGGSRGQGDGLREDGFGQPQASASIHRGISVESAASSVCPGEAGSPPAQGGQRQPDNSAKAGEEFLRLLAARERIHAMHDRGDVRYPTARHDTAFDSCSFLRRSPVRGRSQGPQGTRRSRGRSRTRSRSRSRGKSRGRSRGKSRGRSQSRPHSRSRSRGKSQGRSESPNVRAERSLGDGTADILWKLRLVHRRKELEKLLLEAKRLILQRRDSPGEGTVEQQGSSMSTEARHFLNTIAKGMESGLLASILGERKEEMGEESREMGEKVVNVSGVQQETRTEKICDSLLPHEKVGLDVGGFSRILGLMGDSGSQQDGKKNFTDIEDEERFLYGDEEEVREELAGASSLVGSTRPQNQPATQEGAKPKSEKESLGRQEAAVKPGVEEVKKLLLKAAGLGLGVAEAARIPSGLRGKGTESAAPGHLETRQHPSSHLPVQGVWPSDGPICVTVPGRDTKAGGGRSFGDTIGRECVQGRAVKVCRAPSDPPADQQAATTCSPFPWTRTPHMGSQQCVMRPLFPAYLAPSRQPVMPELPSAPVTVPVPSKAESMQSDSGSCQQEKPSGERCEVIKGAEPAAQVESRKEYHVMELKRLLEHQGCDFIVPVVGFYCQLCEEFLGDMASAKKHMAHHVCDNQSKKQDPATGGRSTQKRGHEEADLGSWRTSEWAVIPERKTERSLLVTEFAGVTKCIRRDPAEGKGAAGGGTADSPVGCEKEKRRKKKREKKKKEKKKKKRKD
ncbi:uncharacterized protein si:ch211-195b21.5 [Brienomyrus brachyistius]|uniref:uncharacterized protein si:ch211-195b21.5 n=1 Tax=Brienomyrus brachyistius TaxID=42636 RepID=UPI0020B238C9|nr:uncharacterized protein si:ch211-195b21.5 [Brienomyrus brachyistius]